MSEEQLKAAKAAETEKGQVEEAIEEISERDLDGVVGGGVGKLEQPGQRWVVGNVLFNG